MHRDVEDFIHVHFDSLRELRNTPIAAGHDGPESHNNHIFDQDTLHEYDDQGESWWGVPTRHAALDIMAGRGWQDGVDRLWANLECIELDQVDSPCSIKRRKVWGDEGDEVDPHRVLCGQYDTAWRRTTKRQAATTGRVIRIVNDMNAVGSTDGTEMFWTGAATLLLTDALEAAGYRVEIYSAFRTTKTFQKFNRDGLISLKIKAADEPMSVDQIVSTVCLAGLFRVYGFYAMHTVPGPCAFGYGSVQALRPDALEAAGLFAEGDILTPQLRSPAQASQFLRETFARFNRADAAAETRQEPPPPPKIAARRIRATGDTYNHRPALKSAGYTWSKAEKCWTAPGDYPAAQALKAAGLAGVTFA